MGATPKSIVSGINRIYGNEHGNVPSSTRIVQDCSKAIRAFHAVYIHGVGMVPGLANRNGHRNYAVGRHTFFSHFARSNQQLFLNADPNTWCTYDVRSIIFVCLYLLDSIYVDYFNTAA